MDSDPSSFIPVVILILIGLSAMFSGSESALFSISHAKVLAMEVNKTRGYKLIKYLKSRPQKMIVIMLLGSNLANTASAALATVYFGQLFDSYSVGIATGVMTLLILVFSDVLPKALGVKYPVGFSQVVVYPLVFIEYVLYPVIWIFEKALLLVVGNYIHKVTEDEVIAMVSMGAEGGTIEKHEQEFIENVLEFNDLTVEDVMTPRTEILALENTTTVADALKFTETCTHSRIPVFEENLDHIVGFITVKMLLKLSLDKSVQSKKLSDIELFEFVKVPSTRKIYSLFLEFKRKHTHIALVFDEHGGVEGIVTMEDILEEIVGEIVDEAEKGEDPIQVLTETSILIDGDVDVADIERALDVEIPSYENQDTASWIILDVLKRFPKKGETVVVDMLRFTIEDMDSKNKKIKKVRVTKA